MEKKTAVAGPSALGAITVIATLTVLAGWVLEIEALKRIAPAWVAMNPLTALCLLMIGTALILRASSKWTPRLPLALGAAACFFAVLKLADIAGIFPNAIDRLLFPEGTSLNPMAPNTATALALLGIATIAETFGERRWTIFGQISATAAGLIGVTALIGYGVGILGLYDTGSYFPMAFHTAVLVTASATALLLQTSRQGILAEPSRTSADGAEWPFSARLLTFSVVTLVVIVAAAVWGETETKKYAEQSFGTRTRELGTLRLLSMLQDAEVGQRGFIITLDPAYLQPYEHALSEISLIRKEVRDSIYTGADAEERAENLDALISERLGMLEETVALVKGGQYDAAIEVVKTNRGKNLMDQIRAEVAEANTSLSQTLAAQQAELSKITKAVRIAEIVGLLVFAFTGFTILKQSKLATRAQAAAVAAANAANKAKSSFLATMSHELRTPMTAILGMCDLLLLGNLPGEERKMTRILTQAAKTLLGLLNDILDLSKIDAGKLALEKIHFRVSGILDDTRALFTQIASQKGLLLHVRQTPGGHDVYVGDPKRMRQVLFNLISNAIKFTDKGEITVQCREEQIAPSSWKVTFDVSDTGQGISAEAKGRLFREFEQEDASTSRKFGGTGLGLAICKRIVKAMSGTIDAESTKGKGSRFFFEVSLPEGDEAVIQSREAASPMTAAAPLEGMKLQILVAEDTPATQFLLSKMLGLWGHTVHVVNNGKEAVEAAREKVWDIILMDMQMPVMDGPEAVREIRRESLASKAPIIALTADAIAENHQSYLVAGCNSVATKPIEWPDLARQITTLVAPNATAAIQDDVTPRAAEKAGAAPVPPLVDQSFLDELEASVGAEILTSLVTTTLKSVREYVADLSHCVARAEPTDIKRAAHRLKGLSAQLGASRMSELARVIECDGYEGKVLADVMRDLEACAHETAGVLEALNAERVSAGRQAGAA